MTSPLRLAVVGAGIMGTNHARIAKQLPGIELVAVVDRDLERASAACRGSAAQAALTVGEITGGIDAAVVAVRTTRSIPANSVWTPCLGCPRPTTARARSLGLCAPV